MLRRLYPYWRPTLGDLAVGGTLLAVAAAVELLHPWPIKWTIDYIIDSQEAPSWLAWLWPAFGERATDGMILGVVLAIVVFAVLHRVIYLGSQYLLIRAGCRVVKNLRCHACDHVHQLGLPYHDKTKVGESIYRIAYDTAAALSLVSQALAPIATGVLTLIGILIVMLGLDWQLTLVAVATVPVFWLTIRLFGRSIERRSGEYHERESALVATLQETLSSIRVVKAFARERLAGERFEAGAEGSVRSNLRLSFTQLAFGACVGAAMAVGTAAVVGLGAHRVVSGHLTTGDVLVFLAYLGMLYQPMNAFSESARIYHASRTQLSRVFEVLDTPSQVTDKPGALEPSQVTGDIVFRSVSFAYEPDRPVLRDISLEIPHGQILALVGRTGAGKTTIASLLLRFYDPNEGSIELDGHDLRDLKRSWLRRQVSVVLQDPVLFSATIAENILYAQPGATQSDVERAARLAQADEFIRSLPKGYETMLGERGVNLSGGQRQRVSIARAFLKDAPILVLDEPTSALDAQTEQSLLEALRRLVEGRTTIVIAHRLSTTRMADKIVVLADGVITEDGSHQQLMRGDTLYRKLYEMQSTGSA